MNTDLIIAWPKSADYPLFRQFVHDNRERFDKVIIVFTETNIGFNYRSFVQEAMAPDNVTFLENPNIQAGEDWRNIAVRKALSISNSNWVWFTEQDFFPKPSFWAMIDEYYSLGYRVMGVKHGDRLHPCSLFIRRDLLDVLNKDFGASPPAYDHFGAIQRQLDVMGIPIGIAPAPTWQHMNGLSQNMRLVEDGEVPNWDIDNFKNYIKLCFDVTVPLHDVFMQTFKSYIPA